MSIVGKKFKHIHDKDLVVTAQSDPDPISKKFQGIEKGTKTFPYVWVSSTGNLLWQELTEQEQRQEYWKKKFKSLQKQIDFTSPALPELVAHIKSLTVGPNYGLHAQSLHDGFENVEETRSYVEFKSSDFGFDPAKIATAGLISDTTNEGPKAYGSKGCVDFTGEVPEPLALAAAAAGVQINDRKNRRQKSIDQVAFYYYYMGQVRPDLKK